MGHYEAGKDGNLLELYLCEQVALEEHLCKLIEQQIRDVDERKYADAKQLLVKIKGMLEEHFTPLNKLLDQIDQTKCPKPSACKVIPLNGYDRSRENERVSRILRDNYSTLYRIAMGNTVLHTTALAFDCDDIAGVALDHLQHLPPLLTDVGELLPHVVLRELLLHAVKVNPSAGEVAVKNMRTAWRTGD